jgi:hypothetical protein
MFVLFAGLSIAGCGEASDKVIDMAQKARESAKANEADVYAKELYLNAEKILVEMNVEIAKKSFAAVKKLAIDAKNTFDAAIREAVNQKMSLGSDVPALLRKAESSLRSVEEMYAKNRSTLKARKIDIGAIAGDLVAFNNVLTEARDDGKSSRYMDAKIKLDRIVSGLAETEQEMSKAISADNPAE